MLPHNSVQDFKQDVTVIWAKFSHKYELIFTQWQHCFHTWCGLWKLKAKICQNFFWKAISFPSIKSSHNISNNIFLSADIYDLVFYFFFISQFFQSSTSIVLISISSSFKVYLPFWDPCFSTTAYFEHQRNKKSKFQKHIFYIKDKNKKNKRFD